MPDMLVKLYGLPDDAAAMARVAEQGVVIRHAMPYDRHHVEAFIRQHFSPGWVSEVTSAWSRQPIPCLLALEPGGGGKSRLLGFASYDTTLRGFFGPTGVDESARGRGIGAALLHASVRGLRGLGYGYAVIGGAGPVGFYEKELGATVIPGSEPGVYQHMIEAED